MLLTLIAFILAIALLIFVHEYGHYRVAVACGVKVLRFSIGLGKPLWRWQAKTDSTEIVLALLPVGGYVKMLDEREAPVAASQRHLAFNQQALRKRVAIVAAGPLANLAFAVVLYAIVNWSGVELAAPRLSAPAVGSVASRAGLIGGERVVQAGLVDEPLGEVAAFEDLRLSLTRGVLARKDVRWLVTDANGQAGREVQLGLAALGAAQMDLQLFEKIGLTSPYTRPLIGQVMLGGAAFQAGLKAGDEVLQIAQQPVRDGQQLRRLIRQSVLAGRATTQLWQVQRGGQVLSLSVTAKAVSEAGQSIGRIDAYVGAAPEMRWVRYGVLEGVLRAVTQTWDISTLTVKMMGQMLIGEASIKNLSGPLTIADFAGKSAGLGLSQYLVFLALLSVSLGVLNLLPLPVLDGGHLMYYLWEGLTGKPVAEVWLDRLQRGGVAFLLVLMSLALFNDVTRIFHL